MTTSPNDSPQPHEEYNSIQASVSRPTCARCNAPLFPDARFCRTCGFPVSASVPTTSTFNAPLHNQPAFMQVDTPNPIQFDQPPSTGLPAPIPQRKNPSSRALSIPGVWRWVLIVGGLLLAIVGGILTLTSSTAASPPPAQKSAVTYKTIRGTFQGSIFITTSTGGGQFQSTNYITADSTGTFYYYSDTDLAPALDIKSLTQGIPLTLIYRPDEMVDMNKLLAQFNEQVIGTGIAYKLVQATIFDSNGQNPKIYISKEYTQYLQAKQSASTNATQQRSVIGIAGLAVGLLIALLALLVPMIVGASRKKQQVALNSGPSHSEIVNPPEIVPSVEVEPLHSETEIPPEMASPVELEHSHTETEIPPEIDASRETS